LRRIEDLTRVIPILIEDVDVPSALRTLHWVDLRHDYPAGVRRIVNALHGISEKPPLGTRATHINDLGEPVGGLSRLASRVGRFILQANDPDSDVVRTFTGEELAEALALQPQEVNDAVDELKAHGLIKAQQFLGTAPYDFGFVEPQYPLYLHYKDDLDFYPMEDVRTVAAAVAAQERVEAAELQRLTGLSAGRLNRAVKYLEDYRLAEVLKWLGTRPYSFGEVHATRQTRQYIMSARESSSRV
jgi:hypothetical protein